MHTKSCGPGLGSRLGVAASARTRYLLWVEVSGLGSDREVGGSQPPLSRGRDRAARSTHGHTEALSSALGGRTVTLHSLTGTLSSAQLSLPGAPRGLVYTRAL